MLDEYWSAQAANEIARQAELVKDSFKFATYLATRPSVLYRPSLSIDGNQWCALYGADLHDGVAGFGDSPALAMEDFDKNWLSALPAKAATK